jgi:hypothetical protein
MDSAEVTIFRLSGRTDSPASSPDRFHSVPIEALKRLDPKDRDQIAWLLQQIAQREDRDEAEAARHGQITGGVWGCVSETLGVRFTVEGQNRDFFVECGLWLRPADDAARDATRIVFTKAEGERFMAAINRFWGGA